MIIDNIDNAERYYGIHSDFKSVFEEIRKGMTCPSADLVSETSSIKMFRGLETRNRDCLYECHKRFIDIHVCLENTEIIEFSDRSANPQQENDEDMYLSDVVYTGEVRLTAGQFVIFFAGELHKPQIGEAGQKVSKCVAKIRV